MNDHWDKYKIYQDGTANDKEFLEFVSGKIFEAQYAPRGSRAKARRDLSIMFLESVKEGFRETISDYRMEKK